MEDVGFQHRALIYRGRDEYLAGTVSFLRAGLAAGEPVLVAVGSEQTRWLRRALGGAARDVRFLPMREVGRNPALIIPLWRDFVDENGGGPVRGIGEPVWAERTPAELEECHRHECLLNVAFADDPDFDLLCPYDAASLPAHVLQRVTVSHRGGHQAEGAARHDDFDPLYDCFAGALPEPVAAPETLRFGLTGLAEVRDRVTRSGERAGMDSREVADLVTAASELAANSVMHGGGSGTLRIWPEDRRLLTEVEDRGRIDEPLVGRVRPGVTQEGGRGLWLANRLCDLVQIRSDERRTVVRLHSAVPERAPGYRTPAAASDPRAEAEASKA